MSRGPLFRVGLLVAALVGWAGCGGEGTPQDSGVDAAGSAGRGGRGGGTGGTAGNAGGTGGSVAGRGGGPGGTGGAGDTDGGAGGTAGVGGAAAAAEPAAGPAEPAARTGGTGGVAGGAGRGGSGGTGGGGGPAVAEPAARRAGRGAAAAAVAEPAAAGPAAAEPVAPAADGWHRRWNGVHGGGDLSGAGRRQRHGRLHERDVHDHLQHRLPPVREHVLAQQQPDVVRNDGDDRGVYAVCHAGQRHRDVLRAPRSRAASTAPTGITFAARARPRGA